ncbi:50S ribosomal protein HLP, mitochondrial-like protein [Tanacetum coccineum]
MRSNLKVVDNSGAKRVMCIQALKGKKGARLGDTIVASVKEAQPGVKVKKGQVVYGVVVRAAMQKGRCDGSEVSLKIIGCKLVNKQEATRNQLDKETQQREERLTWDSGKLFLCKNLSSQGSKESSGVGSWPFLS